MITHYNRNLPHILPTNETLFITFRLYGSLPQDVLERLIVEKKAVDEQIKRQYADDAEANKQTKSEANKRYFDRFDSLLDTNSDGNHWLKEPLIAAMVKKAIHYHNDRDYVLQAYCIMSNHVHLLVTALPRENSFFHVLKSLKGFTARKANRLLNRVGQPFWQPESYDHVVRNYDEFNRIVLYILNNPVKAGLVKAWPDWPYSFVNSQP